MVTPADISQEIVGIFLNSANKVLTVAKQIMPGQGRGGYLLITDREGMRTVSAEYGQMSSKQEKERNLLLVEQNVSRLVSYKSTVLSSQTGMLVRGQRFGGGAVRGRLHLLAFAGLSPSGILDEAVMLVSAVDTDQLTLDAVEMLAKMSRNPYFDPIREDFEKAFRTDFSLRNCGVVGGLGGRVAFGDYEPV